MILALKHSTKEIQKKAESLYIESVSLKAG